MKISSISRVFCGEGVLIEASAESGGREQYLILAEDYEKIATLLADDGSAGLLKQAGERYSALRAARSLLGYSSNTLAGLTRKLRAKGFSKEAAEFAVARIELEGEVDEASDASREAELLLRRGWGRGRILSRLREKGYGRDALEAAAGILDRVDFESRLVAVIKKKWGDAGLPAEPAERKKAVGALCRLGYSLSEISRVTAHWTAES